MTHSSQKRNSPHRVLWGAGLRALLLATITLIGASEPASLDKPTDQNPSSPSSVVTTEERELWAELYFSGFTAATLSEGSASAIPGSLEALEKSPYLVWKPRLTFTIKEAMKKWDASGVVDRRKVLDILAEVVRKKHRGEKVLEPGEVLLVRSNQEILFAAGIRGAKEGTTEVYGPRTQYVRRNPEGARFYVYRQVHRAMRAYHAARKGLPSSLNALTEFVGRLNPDAEKRFDLNKMFEEAKREVTSS